MNNGILPLGKTAIFCVIITISYQLVYLIGEKYFFDKLFYKKSVIHGYVNCWGDDCDWKKYGERAKDYISLLKAKNNNIPVSNDIRGIINDGEYKIAIIGDSFTWGQGIRNEQRMVQLLERRLNKTGRVRIFSYAMMNDNVVENYSKIQILNNQFFNTWIYVFVVNDILVNKSDQYGAQGRKLLSAECPGTPVFNRFINDSKGYLSMVDDGWKNSINRCYIKVFLKSLPLDTIVFLSNDISKDPNIKTFREMLFENRPDIQIVSPISARFREKYKEFFLDGNSGFWISAMEIHPSARANEMYADVLYEEITSNPRWGFNKK